MKDKGTCQKIPLEIVDALDVRRTGRWDSRK